MIDSSTVFSEEKFNQICSLIADGESLRSICERDDMPSRVSFYQWLKDGDGLTNRYAHAREAQADYFADEMIEIADKTTDPAKARIQIDARKWKASKMAPKRYGDKVELEHTGDGDMPVITRIELVGVRPPLRDADDNIIS